MGKNINVLKSTAVVGAFTMLSRVLGLVREMLQSRLIGAKTEQSAFALAFAIPNMARKLFGEGALTAAFVPVFKGELEREGREHAARLARSVMTMVLLMLAAIVALGFCGLECAIRVRAQMGAVESERVVLTVKLVKTLLPYMIFICGAAFGMGILNSMGRFVASSFMPCLLNVLWIGILAWLALSGLVHDAYPEFLPWLFTDYSLEQRIHRVAIAILVAGAAQMAFMMWHMSKAGVSPLPLFSGWFSPKARLVWKNTAIAAFGAGAVQISYLVDTALAQLASEWAAGVISYAERLMDLPLGVVGAAFGTVLLPAFAERFSKGDSAGAREVFVSSSRNMMFVMIPAAVGLAILAPESVSVIYKGGEFDAQAVMRVSRAVACYAAGLAFFGLNKTLVPWFQAQNDMKTPLKVSVSAVVLNMALNLCAVMFLPVEWRHVGLAASTVLCSVLSVAALAVLARRMHGDMGYRALIPDIARIAAAAAAMGAVLVGAKALFCFPYESGMTWRMLALGAEIAVGGVVYLAVAFALMPGMRDLRKLRRRR